jgi:glycosyltransferase involved in cell wall biosynthesis
VTPVDATVLIATYNRSGLLDETLQSIRRMRVSAPRRWEAIVVDNNSNDDTRAVVERHARDFPAPLRYLFEARQGRSSALNTGIQAANGTVIAFTDDDVLVSEEWLDAACNALSGSDRSIAYAGGPVRPIWEAPPPSWLDVERGDLWGTIAIQDHGDRLFVFEEGGKVPLGANMAAMRSLFSDVGAFRADLGRSSGRLVLGQEVPELLWRARASGFRGTYVPAMSVAHHVPARRLTRQYFRSWWFGKGVSRSALERLHKVTDGGRDLSTTRHVLRVPKTMYGSAVRHLVGWLREWIAGREPEAFRHQMMLAYFAGYFWARQRERRAAPESAQRPATRPITT